jgi:hypothetical protein
MSTDVFDIDRIEKQLSFLKEAGHYRTDKWDVLTWLAFIIDGDEWNILFLKQDDFLIIIQQWQS